MARTPSLLRETHKTFIERLGVLAELAGNVNRLSLKLGQATSKSGLRHYLRGGEPTRPALIALAEAGGVNVEWLAVGTGPMRPIDAETQRSILETFRNYRKTNGIEERQAIPHFCSAYNNGTVARAPGVTKLAVYELLAWLENQRIPSTGTNRFVQIPLYDLDVIDDQSFATEGRNQALSDSPLILRRDLLLDWKLDPEQLALFIVRSEEVVQSVRPGDWILCDCRTSPAFHRSGLFVLRDEGNYTVRRVRFSDHGRLRLIREGDHDDEIAEERKLKDVELVGRAILNLRRLRS